MEDVREYHCLPAMKKCLLCQSSEMGRGNSKYCSGKCYFEWRRTHFRHSEKTKREMREARSNELHPAWKGDKVGYYALHRWIRKHFGKPSCCEDCGKENTPSADGRSSVHWANLDGKYDRLRRNWKPLCVPCHRGLDGWSHDDRGRYCQKAI